MSTSFRRVRVTIWLDTPLVACPQWPRSWYTLDGVLYAALGRQLDRADETVWDAVRELVAERDGCAVASGMYWRARWQDASAELPPRFPVTAIRRLLPSDLEALPLSNAETTINPASGPYRNVSQPYVAWPVQEVSWIVEGDAEGIRRALEWLPGIGALTQKGWGRIHEATVDEDPEAPHPWLTPDGAVARPIPWRVWRRWIDGQAVAVRHGYGFATSAPPYWRSDREVWCAVPPAWPLLAQ